MATVTEGVLGVLILKLLGSVAGTFLALIVKMPRSMKSFQQRASFSIVAGIILSPIAATIMRQFLDIPNDAETSVAIATITAFASWWVGKRFIDLADSWTISKKPNAE